MVNPRKRPEFPRWPSKSIRSLKPAWRKQHGINSKIRIKRGGKQPVPSISYGAPRNLRYLHPSRMMEVRIHNVAELGKVNPEKEAVKIASTVGAKKRKEIIEKSQALKIKVLNPR
ncbi:MAG: 50S ribosomal protein L32e [Candidatus Aenigmarchaeota archaeon]|nr:50S ribosomal protein L32e [Candidatus Aenigmarchaeota archaeon]